LWCSRDPDHLAAAVVAVKEMLVALHAARGEKTAALPGASAREEGDPGDPGYPNG